jgi:hypothetical protein
LFVIASGGGEANVYGSSYYCNFRTSSFKQVACLILDNNDHDMTCVFLLQIHPIRKLYLLNVTFWLDVYRVGVKNSTALWPWQQGCTNNIFTRFSVITSVANADIYFLYFTGTCQYAVIRLVVNYQSPLCFI